MSPPLETRFEAEEQRLLVAERVAAPPPPTTADATLVALPAPSSSVGGANAFNPAMSLILSGGYTRTSRDPATYSITGFQLPKGSDAGPGSRGFSLAESELGLAANIDPWLDR